MREVLSGWCLRATEKVGSVGSVLASVGTMAAWVVWAATLRFDTFSQLVLSSETSVVSYVLLFLVLHAQGVERKASDRSTQATHVKLDALIAAVREASNSVIGAEERSEEEIAALSSEVRAAAQGECKG